jgi:hypothetical protein
MQLSFSSERDMSTGAKTRLARRHHPELTWPLDAPEAKGSASFSHTDGPRGGPGFRPKRKCEYCEDDFVLYVLPTSRILSPQSYSHPYGSSFRGALNGQQQIVLAKPPPAFNSPNRRALIGLTAHLMRNCNIGNNAFWRKNVTCKARPQG